MSKEFTADGMIETLLSGGDINIPGLGKIKVAVRPARTARNPRTGEKVNVPAKKVLKFSQSSTITKRLNGGA